MDEGAGRPMNQQHRGNGMTSQRTRDRLIRRLQERGIDNTAVLEVISNTKRHIFIDEALASRAYDDTALPIGHGQTNSQPFVVALMTQTLLRHGVPQRVLEIGTGSGYQAAVLAQLVKEVFSVERIEALIHAARRRFQELKLRNIRITHGDGLGGAEGGGSDVSLVPMRAGTQRAQIRALACRCSVMMLAANVNAVDYSRS